MKGIRNILLKYKNLFVKLWFLLLPDGYSRAEFLRNRDILKGIGDNVYFYSRIMPSDGRLLKIGNNVTIATNVRFLGHDRIDITLSGMFGCKYKKWFDCIAVGNNVFIGADSVILPGVKIGDNSIIGAGAVVSKDLPGGFVWGGVPVKQIGVFEDFVAKRKQVLNPESDERKLWEKFELVHLVENESAGVHG